MSLESFLRSPEKDAITFEAETLAMDLRTLTFYTGFLSLNTPEANQFKQNLRREPDGYRPDGRVCDR